MLRPSQDEAVVAGLTKSDWPDEEAWVRRCIIRLRTLLRFAKDDRVEGRHLWRLLPGGRFCTSPQSDLLTG